MSQHNGIFGGVIAKIILILIAVGFVISSIIGTGFLGSNQTLAPDVRLQIGQETLTNGMIYRAAQLDGQGYQAVQQSLINDMVLSQAYINFGGVNPNFLSIEAAVTQNPLFFSRGQFSNERYRTLLAQSGYEPDQYVDERVRREIKTEVLMNGLVKSDFVLPSDVAVIEQLLGQQRDIQIATLSMDQWIDPTTINVTEEEALSYYDAHLADYYEAEKYKLSYVSLNRDDFIKTMSETSIPDDQIKAYYEAHADEFKTEARYDFHVIVVNDKVAADHVIEELDKGQPFSQLAATESLRPELLDLGWFTESEVAKNFPHFADLTQVGEYSYVNQDGNHYIIELNAYEPAASYSDLIPTIKQHMIDEKATEAYSNALAQLEALTPSNFRSLTTFIQSAPLPLTIEESGWNTDDNTLLNQPQIAEVLEDGSLYPKGNSAAPLSPLIYTNNGDAVYVLQVIDFIPSRTLSFDAVKTEILAQLQRTKMESAFAEKVQSLTASLNQGETIESITFDEAIQLTRQSRTPNDATVALAYDLVPDVQSYGALFTSPTTATIVKLNRVENRPANDNEKAMIQNYFEHTSQQNIMMLLYEYVQNNNVILNGQ